MSIRRVGQAVLFLALIGAALPSAADSLARIVRLSYLDGDVQIDRGTGRGFERAVLNLPLTQGAQLATREDSSAEVEFEDGSTLRLIPNTSVVFHDLSLRTSGERLSRIELLEGTIYLAATRKKDDFSVTSGGQEITLPRQASLRISRRGPEIRLAVFKGDVDVRAERGSVRVKKDETFTLLLDDPSQYRLVKGVDAESYDAWDQERDQYRQTYASTHHDGYNSQYNYGYSDLNYFGSFFQYSSYGWLWRPYNVNPSWDPFGDGAWVYYPGYGYMWVSAYPWGWTPYRYGSWVYIPGYGWCWQSGRHWNTWYGVPVIHRAPPGYVMPVPPPVVRTGPGVVPGTVIVGAGPIQTVRGERFNRWTMEQERQGNKSTGKGVRVSPVPTPPAATVAPAATAPAVTNAPAVTTPVLSPAPARPMSRRADGDAEAPVTKGTVRTPPSIAPAAVPPATPPRATTPAPQPVPVVVPPPAPPPTAPAAPKASSPQSSATSGQKSATSSAGNKSRSTGGSSRSTSSTSGSKSTTGDKK